jgi:ABC-type branched-subunit amino acid transport system ATPase component
VIELHGHNVSALDPAARARLGLGRTFQKIQLFDSLSVRENIQLGREATIAGANPIRHLRTTPGQRAELDAAVAEAARTCGITDLLDLQAGILPTGQRRLVEFARCLAGDFDVLLLDEPSSGLDRVESEIFGRIVRSAVDSRHVAVLIVEHDMTLVMGICDNIYVLDFGVVLFEGEPKEVAASQLVRDAYLGGEASVETALAETAVTD